jgi:prepilin signal peptidase PulO-like enzyme (type II secretory pathway)
LTRSSSRDNLNPMFFSLQPLDWAAAVILFAFLVPICLIDIKYFTIPNTLVLLGTCVLFLYFIFFLDYQKLLSSIFNGALGFSVIFVFWFIFKKQIGLGDAKLSFFLAAGLGFIEWWGALFIASLAAMLFGLIRIKKKKMTLKDKLPLAPFFGIGTAALVILKIILSILCPSLFH